MFKIWAKSRTVVSLPLHFRCFFVCVDVCLRLCRMDSFNYFILVQTLIWREAVYWLWKKAGWLKQPNWCVKKNKQEKREEGKKTAAFPQESETTLGSLTCNHPEFAQKHLRTCVGVVFTSLKAESRAHENSHAAETNPYHKKNNRGKYNHVLEFF